MQKVVLRSPFDAHLHLRDGEMLKTTAKIAAASFAGAIVMPNLTPPLTSLQALSDYRRRILEHCGEGERGTSAFAPLPALFLTDKTTIADLRGEGESGAHKPIAVKLYPSGVTTNAEEGVRETAQFGDLFEAMSDLGIVLSIHGETNGAVLEREAEFAPIYARLAKTHPRLKIVMEHISTKALADLLERHENLYATITLHHLLYTIDDLLGGALRPHLFCKPIVKSAADRAALRALAFAGHEKVAFGSDSAPHLRSAKEQGGAAGVFSAPVLLPKLVELFAQNDAIDSLQAFVSDNACNIYDLKRRLSDRTIELVDTPFILPCEIDGIVPMCAGETIGWSQNP